MKRTQSMLAAAALSVAFVGAAQAEYAWPLANPSFESPALSSGDPWYGGVASWGYTAGIGTTWENPWVEGAPATNGDQFLYGNYDGFDVTQQTGTLSANTRYRLLVDVYPLSTGTPRASITIEETDTWSAVFAEKHFQPTWAPTRQDFALPSGQWTTVELRFGSAGFPTLVGKNMRIHVNGSRLALDNVRFLVDDQPHDFHISSTSGNNTTNNGFSSGAPWANFNNLGAYMPLMPGERILLKAGDVFTDELNIRGKGISTSLVQVGRYGAGVNPIIRRSDKVYHKALVWNNASHARISGIDAETAKLGIFLRYEWTDSGSQNVTIEDCNFRDMDDTSLDPALHNFELAWSNGIFVGGQAWNTAEFTTRLDGLTIRNVTSVKCAHLFGTAWYYPGLYKSRLKNLIMEDCWAFDNLMGSISLINVDGGHAKRVHAIGGGGVDTWCGSTLGMIQSSKNFVFDDCEFAFLDRAQSGDGSGMDFEGNTENVTMQNCVIHNNDASAVLILSTEGAHTNLVLTNNTFYNNAKDPWNSEINSEIQGSNASHTGVITNNGIYRGSAAINFLSGNANWTGFTISGNRQLEFASVSKRPTWWNFDVVNNLEGWGGFNQWISNTVSSGVLWGQSNGADPYASSPATWVSSTVTPYAWVRMSQTAGTVAELFYITDVDTVWNATKSVSFPIIADGTMRDYFVDLDASVNTKGVITQVRLDPTTTSGSNMAIDFVRLTDSTDLGQAPPPAIAPDPVQLVFTSVAAEDGEVLESARNSGIGGTANSTATTFRLGDDASNRAYRQFLSFDTSAIPDDAVIVEATLSITRVGGVTGSIPVGVAGSVWGDLLVDVANPSFGATALATGDWQAAATKLGASKFAWPAYNDGMAINSRLEAVDLGLVNKTGKTQFRVRYQNDDDNDNTADFVTYATANSTNGTQRPKLTIKYASAWTSLMYDNFEANLGSYTSGGIDAMRYTGTTYAWHGAAAGNIQDNSGTASALTSRVLDLHNPGYTEMKIDYRFYALSFEAGENFYVEYFNGTSWVIVANMVVGTNFTNNSFNLGSVIINEANHVYPTNAQIRFRSDASDDADDIYLDEINLLVK